MESERGIAFRCRGNVTKEERGVSGSVLSSSQRQYDIAGNVIKVIHPAVKTGPAAGDLSIPETVVSYNDSFTSSPGVSTFAFPTSITHPGGLTTRVQYQYGLGAVHRFTDPNNQNTTYEYGDALDRLTKITHPIGETVFEYEPATNLIRTKKSRLPGNYITAEKIFDGLGRERKSTSLEFYLGSNSTISTETEYDMLGRAWRTSNPYRGASPGAWTETLFDALDRPLEVKATDGAITRFSYNNYEVLMRDPANKWSRRINDSLGRLKEVVEDPNGSIGSFVNSGGLAFSTSYTYDSQDQLKSVVQAGRDRSFTYDPLGRLQTVVSPEMGAEGSPNGTISYSYDPAGNLISKFDARSVTTSLFYDIRNRVKKRTYSGVTTPEAVYCYDGDVSGDCAGAPTGTSFNLKGRLTRVKSSESTTDYLEYDALGRVRKSLQTTAGMLALNPFEYTYDEAGLSSVKYPSGRTISYDFDLAGRVKSVTGTLAAASKT